jgi:RNA polymerase sigma-70 factor (ECF subfamily)
VGAWKTESSSRANPAPREAADPISGTPDERSSLARRLFEEHNRDLLSFLTARLRSVHEAQDIAQEAYVRLLQLDQPGAVGFLRRYLFRIAANLVVDRKRRQAKERAISTLFDAEPQCAGVDRAVMAREEAELIQAALAELPQRCRRAFVLHTIEGVSTPEVAVMLKVSERMIRVYVSQAYAHCERRLQLDKEVS